MNAARFQALHTAHGQGLLAYFVRRIPIRDDAADLLAETYLILWRRITDVPAGEERAWLYTVARNVLANHHRGIRRRLTLADRLRADLAHTPPQPVPTEDVLAVRSPRRPPPRRPRTTDPDRLGRTHHQRSRHRPWHPPRRCPRPPRPRTPPATRRTGRSRDDPLTQDRHRSPGRTLAGRPPTGHPDRASRSASGPPLAGVVRGPLEQPSRRLRYHCRR